MRIVMMTCASYRDTWRPFIELFRKFWPDCPYPLTMVTDAFVPGWGYQGSMIEYGDVPWFKMFAAFCARAETPVLMLQDDFFLDGPVRPDLVEYAHKIMKKQRAGAVRLYPCPGADGDIGDPYIGSVARGAAYRISCQASIWNPVTIRKMADFSINSPRDFEIVGSAVSDLFPEPVLAWQRDVTPYPLSYLVTAVVRGRWLQGAKDLCALHGIEADFSKRGMYVPPVTLS